MLHLFGRLSITLTEMVKPGQATLNLYTFTVQEIPESATEVRYRLVYRGGMEQENDRVSQYARSIA